MRNLETAPPDVVPLQYQRNTLTSNGQRAAQLLITHFSLLIKTMPVLYKTYKNMNTASKTYGQYYGRLVPTKTMSYDELC